MSEFNTLLFPSFLRPSSIQEQLNKPETKLEELLDNEKFSFQLKNGNPRLMDYFTKNTQNLVQLIDYIIKPPPDPNDPKRSYKYPFMACEIFEKDIATIINGVLVGRMPETDETYETENSTRTSPQKFNLSQTQSPKRDNRSDLKYFQSTRGNLSSTPKGLDANKLSSSKKPRTVLEHLFTFVDTDEELYPILSGYFFKVIEVLFRRNPAKMIEFVYEKEGTMLKILKHIYDKSLSEVLTMFICYETFHYEEERPAFLETKNRVIDQLIDILIIKEDIESSTNASNCLCEILSKYESIVDGKEIVNKILNESVLDRIFENLIKKSNTTLSNVCNVLLFLVEFCNPARPVRNLSHSYKLLRQQNRNFDNHPLILSIVKNIALFSKILQDDNLIGGKVASKENSKPLGMGKLRLIELTDKIIKLNNKAIYNKIGEIHLIETITDLFVKLSWNNILHNTYEKLVITLLGKNDPLLLKVFFEGSDMLNIIMDAVYEDKLELQQRSKKTRKGNVGHIINIANYIVQYGETVPEIKQYSESNARWCEFTETCLKQVNEISNIKIAGVDVKEMFPNKREYGLKRGITDELESEGFVSFKDQINMKDSNEFGTANIGYNLSNQTRPKVDELDTPSPNLKPLQYGGAASLPNPAIQPFVGEENQNMKKPIYYNFSNYQTETKNEFVIENKKFKENILQQINIIRAQEVDNRSLSNDGRVGDDHRVEIESRNSRDNLAVENHNKYGDYTAGLILSPLPMRQVKSTEENKSSIAEASYLIDEGLSLSNDQQAKKQERRKLTLVSRKSYPNAPNLPSESNESNEFNQTSDLIGPVEPVEQNESSIQSARNSYSNGLGKKVKIKIKRADTQDGSKVLEAIYKYKGIESEDQLLQGQQYPLRQSAYHLSSPSKESYSMSITDSTTYIASQFSMSDALNKNTRSKSKT